MELEAHLKQLSAEASAARRELAAREAAVRAPVVAEARAVATLRAEAEELKKRIEGYQSEVATLGAPTASVFNQALRIGRICLALLGLFAVAQALPSHTPQAIVAGLAIMLAGIAWGIARD